MKETKNSNKGDELKVGMRFNDNKLRWRNFPLFLIRPLIEVAHYGESKYKTFNFLDGMTVLDSIDCLMRHLDEFLDPTRPDYDLDPVDEKGDPIKDKNGDIVRGSQRHHLAHVAWNALVCLYMIIFRPELDDRWKGPSNDKRKVQ